MPISFPAALDSIPSAIHLGHIQQDTEPPSSQTSNTQPNKLQFSDSALMSLRGGMPPVPAKLVKRIQEGSFIEMAELLPDLLQNASLPDDSNKNSKPKSHSIGSIIEWVRCFSCYIAVISRSQPQRVIDLLGYLSHPQGASINDAIPKELCSLNYITVDAAIKHILALSPGTLLAKLDIKNAFRLYPFIQQTGIYWHCIGITTCILTPVCHSAFVLPQSSLTFW